MSETVATIAPIAPRQLGEMVAGELLRKCWLADQAGADLETAAMGTVEVLSATPALPWVHVEHWPDAEQRSDAAWARDYYLGVVSVLRPAQGWRKRSAAVRHALQQSSERLADVSA